MSRYVESDPPWAKQLEGEMVLGKHVLTFTARSPASNATASCQMVVHVKVMMMIMIMMIMMMMCRCWTGCVW